MKSTRLWFMGQADELRRKANESLTTFNKLKNTDTSFALALFAVAEAQLECANVYDKALIKFRKGLDND